jgi:hypothetical protein
MPTLDEFFEPDIIFELDSEYNILSYEIKHPENLTEFFMNNGEIVIGENIEDYDFEGITYETNDPNDELFATSHYGNSEY